MVSSVSWRKLICCASWWRCARAEWHLFFPSHVRSGSLRQGLWPTKGLHVLLLLLLRRWWYKLCPCEYKCIPLIQLYLIDVYIYELGIVCKIIHRPPWERPNWCVSCWGTSVVKMAFHLQGVVSAGSIPWQRCWEFVRNVLLWKSPQGMIWV